MIRIHFDEPNDRAWQRWRREGDEETQRLKAVADANELPPEISSLYKRKSIKGRFFFSETGPFGGKCAYCETYLTHFQKPDIEHYRPKRAVTDAQDVPVMVDY